MKTRFFCRVTALIRPLSALLLCLSLALAALPVRVEASEETGSEEETGFTEEMSSEEETESEEETSSEDSEEEGKWATFFLICNEGMSNKGGNFGNTMMAVSMNEETGKIRLMTFTWDTFVTMDEYDIPQRIDIPYRNNGPEETTKVFNENFDMDVKHFLSLNFLNLATLIDAYGGVNVDISRAERNALNGMVASKKENLQQQVGSGLLSELVIEMLADEYNLDEYGPNTHLKGLQAVAFGWLQYDSVYNCCLRDVNVIGSLFASMGTTISKKVLFYTNDTKNLENPDDLRMINLDELTEDDVDFLMLEMAPVFQTAYHNLEEEDIRSISLAMVRAAYNASRQGVNIFETIDYAVFPLEAQDPYDVVAGTRGHLVDYEKNSEAMKKFLFDEEYFPEEEE